MNSLAATRAGASELAPARGSERAAYRAIRVLAAVATAFVVIASFRVRPAPGGHGEVLAVACALLVFEVG